MLQGRLFAYGDAHRYRLGINHTQLPVNAPHAAPVANYGRDGAMRFNDNSKRAKNYEPNSFGGPVQSDAPHYGGLEATGTSGSYPWDDRQSDDFAQAGVLYRMIPEDSRQRLVDAIADGLSQVSKDDIIERSPLPLPRRRPRLRRPGGAGGEGTPELIAVRRRALRPHCVTMGHAHPGRSRGAFRCGLHRARALGTAP
jgi:hypothetical protein